ncbi:MAG: phosphoribosyltransferase [Acidimicrobiales bacterium]
MRPKPAFADRAEAGRALARALAGYGGRDDVVVLGLPRGGVPVAAEVASALGAVLDVLVVRKLGVPGHAELAMGAIAAGGTQVLNDDVVRALAIPESTLAAVTAREHEELERRLRSFRGDRPFPETNDHVVILVDDGLATGATMRAAIAAVRSSNPERVVVGVPVAAPSTCRDLGHAADEVICVRTPEPFVAVGQWYLDFDPPEDEEIRRLLSEGGESL